jgi:hypothetical protein
MTTKQKLEKSFNWRETGYQELMINILFYRLLATLCDLSNVIHNSHTPFKTELPKAL